MAKLMPDEFAPADYAKELDFWQIPKGVMKCNNLSWGAKALYAVIYGSAYKYKEAKPSYKALQKHLGNPSKSTMQRWISELVDARLIRVIQRGRGISNVYRLRRSPYVGNMTEEEFNGPDKVVYAGLYTEEPLLVDADKAKMMYLHELSVWRNETIFPRRKDMPKPYAKLGAEEIKEREQAWWWAVKSFLFESNLAYAIEFEEEAEEWIHPADRD